MQAGIAGAFRRIFRPATGSQLVELECEPHGLIEAGRRAMEGDIVILRNVEAVRAVRAALDRRAVAAGADPAALAEFHAGGGTPDLPTLRGLAAAIKGLRTEREISALLAPMIRGLALPPPIRLEGGIPRLVLPAETVASARASGLFEAADFVKARADGPTEIFMPRPANIHRDYNRPHSLLQCNLWFPLHDADAATVLRLYPQAYREAIHDMDATAANLARLGPPLRYALGFGDLVLFHGEHLHTSPEPGPTRRLSYDFRIAADCEDDTAHYRDCFLDLRNFEAGGGALAALNELEQAERPGAERIAALLDAFDAAPFAEDRNLMAARRAIDIAPDLAHRALRRIVERSPHWFWVAEAGEMLATHGFRKAAIAALEKARRLARNAPRRRGYAPISYANPRTQPDPLAVARRCEAQLAALR
ncbi:hypothetical protein [Desertibaculum subflavum]|uniref:hypothetical protein n=1 Tax=Desertibaculum subflavum TaxID=2268458 RepID=UPI000E673325